MKGRQIRYSEAELAFCAARPTLPRRQLHAAFVLEFGRDDISLENFKAMCTRQGWKTGRTGCFVKGLVPHNKGKPHPARGRAAHTQFKKGALPHNAKGAGHERIDSKDGYVILIVDEPNPWSGATTKPVHKHRWLWEQKNGPLPKGMALKCLDGDKTNTDPSNWEPVRRAVLARLNGGRHKKRMAYDAAPAQLKPALMAIAKIEQAISEKAAP